MNSIPKWMRPKRETTLFPDLDVVCVPLFEINPDRITVIRLPVTQAAHHQPNMSRAVWRPAPGRKASFIVKHDETLIGLLFLASPVFNLGPRDKYLGIDKLSPHERGQKLKRVMDLSICVGAQPLAWYWNVGKLCAMLATTLADDVGYAEPLEHLTTTSLYGKGSQYNRIWRFLGYTKGYGHEHISDEQYDGMRRTLAARNMLPSSRFGTAPNLRKRVIEKYRSITGDDVFFFHGNKRAVYTHPACGGSDRNRVIAEWYERWGLPRWRRKRGEFPPYNTGIYAARPLDERLPSRASDVQPVGAAPIKPDPEDDYADRAEWKARL